MALPGVTDGLGQTPLREAELFGGEQSGSGEQPAPYGGGARAHVGQQGSGRSGQGDGGQGPGQVERDERPHGGAGFRGLDGVQALGGRHQQHIGHRRVGDTAYRPVP